MQMSSVVLVVLVLLSIGCEGKSPTPAKVETKTAKSEAKPDAKAQPRFDAADGGATKAAPSEPPQPAGDLPAVPPGDEADPLGKRFLDPPWFRKELFPDATAAKASRSQRDEKGLFSSQILFDLKAGTTAEQCAKTLKDAVGKHVPDLKQEDDAKAPGRLRLSGTTDRYRVTMMCGDAKGTMRAFVSFEWTS
ncbi:MAG TPA: hypothetical protein VFG69_09365 [Nannocystaceae bacterium]|nr:hypothetical protein [Nannocystaceae bacterium]